MDENVTEIMKSNDTDWRLSEHISEIKNILSTKALSTKADFIWSKCLEPTHSFYKQRYNKIFWLTLHLGSEMSLKSGKLQIK